MIFQNVARIMLYVGDTDSSAEFWTDKIGFIVRERFPGPDNTNAYVVSPRNDSETVLVLLDRDAVKKYSPEVDSGTPSLMFCCENVEETREKLNAAGVTTGEVVEMGDTAVCNFCDPEGNYFAFTAGTI